MLFAMDAAAICCAKGGALAKMPVARMRSTEVEAEALVSAFSVS